MKQFVRVIAAGLASGGLSLATPAEIVRVYVFDNDFSIYPDGGPVEDAVIHVGDTVRWVFQQTTHTATSLIGSQEVWDSGGPVPPGFEYDHTFTHAGVFPYYCVFHGVDFGNGTAIGMVGTVTVRCPGDLNGDHACDLSDLAVLLASFGSSPASYAQGDLDGDLDVDLEDLARLLAAYGTICD